jgi:hypothetical protein
MASDNPVHDLLSLHLTGKLGTEDRDRFREHLAACPECREELEFLSEVQGGLARHGRAWLDDHPSAELLVASVRGELEGLDADRVRRHIGYCATCSLEARWVTGATTAGAAPARAAKRRLPLPSRTLLAAAAVLAGVALTLTLGRVLRPTPSEFYVPQFVGRTQLGSGGGIVTLRPGEAQWNAYFLVDVPEADFPCSVAIVEASGRTILSTNVSGPEDLLTGQHLFLSCARATCPPGSYSIRITSATGAAVETLTFRVEEPGGTSAP